MRPVLSARRTTEPSTKMADQMPLAAPWCRPDTRAEYSRWRLRRVRWVVKIPSIVMFTSLASGMMGARMAAQAPSAAGASAADLVALAIEAMGGETRLATLKSLVLESIGHGFALEQSERPEGPWLTTYTQRTEIRDYEHKRTRLETERRNWSFPKWSPPQVSIAGPDGGAFMVGTRWVPTAPVDIDTAMALSPERILLTARSASDLHVMPDELQQNIKQHVVVFTYQSKRMRLLLNPWTHLPTMFEQISNDPRNVWGDVTERRWYSFWTLERGGLMYPRQTTTEWNGLPFTDETVQVLTVDELVDDAKFSIPGDTKAASAALARSNAPRPAPPTATLDETKVIAITDNVVEIPGGYNVSLVKQPDGVVVIEGTTSSTYSQLVMAFAAKRFPDAPIKALVTTSDAWPHIGGVREYVAKGIPIYPLDLNVSILSRLTAAPHAIAPDTLARQPKEPIFRPVAEKTTLGSGDTRIELVPIRGETGERMMVAWLPGQHLLYSSDAIQHAAGGTGFFMPAMLMEVQAALEREHIAGVERVFGMHLSPTPWSAVVQAIEAAKGGS
jgi:glyoxylase-like metal-dependent hydrolase (beta-lactamase superfamily II)